MKLYPLKFKPILQERLWGGKKLKTVLQKPIPSQSTGESWELSGIAGAISEVANGALAGISLKDLITEAQEKLLGQNVVERFGFTFPILIKFLDAEQDLSIQVHPNDTLAQKHHNCAGKTEMWYIMHAEPQAQLVVGFAKNTDKEEYLKRVKQGTLLQILQYEKVTQGDTFFIPPGTIHAIGAGVLLAEIQQTSDITYRVFDFNRKDKNGQLRALHTDLAAEALNYARKDDTKVAYAKAKNTANPMVACPYFTTHFLDVTQNLVQDLSQRHAFTIYVCVEGQAQITNDWGSSPIKKGETLLIAAASTTVTITTQGTKLLEVTL